MSDSNLPEGPIRKSSRQPKPSSKGIWWQLDTLEKNFKRTLSTWKTCCNKIEVLLSDSRDCLAIRSQRDNLSERADHVISIYKQLSRLIEKECQTGEHVDLGRDIEDDIIERYEACENAHSDIMKRISLRLKELEEDSSEISSRRSSRSGSVKSSQHSHRSTRSIRSETASKAAELKTKLKYLDVEANAKLRLEKIQTMRDLDIAEAKLEIIDGTEDVASELDEAKKSLPKADRLGPFLESTVKFKETQNITDSPLDWKYEAPSCRQPNVMIDEVSPRTAGTAPEIVSASVHQPSKMAVNNRASINASSNSVTLNPNISDFVPQQSYSANVPVQGTRMYPPTGSHYVPINNPVSTQGQLLTSTSSPGVASNVNNLDSSLTTISDIAKSFAEQVNLSRLPPPEPSIFQGDPLKYPNWKSAFQTLIDQRQIPSSERIHYLRKYLGESVRDVVENFFLLSSENAYTEAKALLDQRYGDPFVIGNAFRDKLEKWPKILPRDSKSLLRFSDFLKQCEIAMESIGTLNMLNDDRENRKLLTKLPDWIVTRWGRIVVKHKEEQKQFPPFKIFVEFISQEARIACDPVTSLQSVKGDFVPGLRNNDNRRGFTERRHDNQTFRGRTFMTDTSERSTTNMSRTDSKPKVKCLCCDQFHEMDTCKEFLAKTVENRKGFARNNRLCFGCLGSGHVSKRCNKRKQCNICQKYHPTSLHGDLRNPNTSNTTPSPSASSIDKPATKDVKPERFSSQTGTVFMSNTESSAKSSMIVPVYVSHVDTPSEEVLVYALLDTQSDTTFILSDTYRKLGLSGTDVKLSLSTMFAENQIVDSCKVKGLIVRGFDSSVRIPLPTVFTRDVMPANRSHIPTSDMARHWHHLNRIADKLLPIQNCDIGLLIGYNCPRALIPREVIPSLKDGPYGQRTDLGWGIVGIVDSTRNDDDQLDSIGHSHRVLTFEVPKEVSNANDRFIVSMRSKVKEIISPSDLTRMFEMDFIEHKNYERPLSHDDRKFLTTLQEGIHVNDSHYEMPLPFRAGPPNLPNNKCIAIQRLAYLKKRLRNDATYADHYQTFMNNIIRNGFAERVPENELNQDSGQEWYIPHHGIYHPQKPGKLRVVYDCSARYMGQSLNDHLLQGPDLTNSLIGLLCRFRKESIAVVCDIEQMFHQFKVNTEHRNYLKFLWFEDGDLTRVPVEYRMSVHLFGAVSSPGCANFGLKQLANDYEADFGQEVANFIKRDFYVDDGLKSLSSVEEAISLIKGSIEMCSKRGIRLHKLLSNSKEVLAQMPEKDCAKELNLNLSYETLPTTKTLGIQWCIELDAFQFRISLSSKPPTRRGMLSTLSSVYDPLGVISPVILVAKQLLQEMCKDQIEWDSPLPDSVQMKWERWKRELLALESLKINRSLKPVDFGEVKTIELHHFSDASSTGYGQCSYVRLVNAQQQVHCSLVIGKSRVVPLKSITIPRLELTAALTSVKISTLLHNELDYANVVDYFWTDSNVVLGYIANDSKRFHVFVANRVQQIRSVTDPSQWNYVNSINNPADIASRGSTPIELGRSSWFSGPDFLWKTEIDFRKDNPDTSHILLNDPEVRKAKVFSTSTSLPSQSSILQSLEYFSSWSRAKRVIAMCLNLKDTLLAKRQKVACASITVNDLHRAEIEIVKHVQSIAFKDEKETLQSLRSNGEFSDKESARKRNGVMKGTSSLYRLDPFLDPDGLIRVGGRIQRADLDSNLKHPIILPKRSHITDLVIRHYHEQSQHQGRGITTNTIRSHGFWIIGCSSIVSSLLSKCVICRKLRSQTQIQKMADLPSDRLEDVPPFTYCGVDLFGPWYIKESRKVLKRYGVLFTCLSSRAIHLETANSLDTDSFINALRRFVSLRGPIRHIRCDQGTNFVGTETEFRNAMSELDFDQIRQYLLDGNCDFVQFKMNVPSASHMGGIWERQIRTVRNILSTLLSQLGTQLDDESLRTLMAETTAIVNSRPLTVENLNDPLSLEPLTPNHILTMKTNVILPPPGQFMRNDIYSRKRWRRVQFLVNEFWNRWRKEFLSNIQARQKWIAPKRNLRIGDIVLIKDDNLARNLWRLGRVCDVYKDNDSLVRKVKLIVGSPKLDRRGARKFKLSELERPIHKLVLLHETEDDSQPRS